MLSKNTAQHEVARPLPGRFGACTKQGECVLLSAVVVCAVRAGTFPSTTE